MPAQEADTIRLKREAKAKNGFYVEPEGKVVFAVRIRGINDMHPKTRKILQLLRLRQIHNGVFVRVRGPGGLERCSSAIALRLLGGALRAPGASLQRTSSVLLAGSFAWGGRPAALAATRLTGRSSSSARSMCAAGRLSSRTPRRVERGVLRCPRRAGQQGHDEHAAAGGAVHHVGHAQPEVGEGAHLQARLWQGAACASLLPRTRVSSTAAALPSGRYSKAERAVRVAQVNKNRIPLTDNAVIEEVSAAIRMHVITLQNLPWHAPREMVSVLRDARAHCRSWGSMASSASRTSCMRSTPAGRPSSRWAARAVHCHL